MTKHKEKPGRFWAYIAVVTGGLLILAGFAAAAGYLGLPVLLDEVDLFGAQLGQVATIFLGLGGGAMALFHGLGSLRGETSQPFQLPPILFFLIAFALVIGLGNVLLYFEVADNYLFPFLFFLGAALPLLAVLSWSSQRLGWPVSWRQASLSFVSGATLSIMVTLVLGLILSGLFFILVLPVELLAGSLEDMLGFFGDGFLEQFFFSPYVIVLLFITALQAPIPEEFAKALGPGFMLNRIHNDRQAFMLGLASGAGFAVLENMLYEGIYATWSGWTWGGVTVLRAIGSVLHPLCTGIVVMALFRNRRRGQGWFGRIAGAYLLAVLLHTLWNGGFEALLLISGIDHYSGIGPDFNIYGESIAVILVVYLVLFSAFLWWLLARIVRGLAREPRSELPAVAFSARSVALWAAVALVVILPIGAAIGPAWGGATDVFAAGPLPKPTPTPEPPPAVDPGSASEATPSAPSTPATQIPLAEVSILPEARIAFQSNRGGMPQIYLLDGGELRLLTASYVSGKHPSWSPDGNALAFYTGTIAAGNAEIYTMDADGSNPRQVTYNPASDYDPAWSPDGEKIVFVSDRDGDPELFLVDAAGDGEDEANLERLTFDGLYKSDPDWSPDGSYVVYSAGKKDALDIYMVDTASGEITQLTQSENNDTSPSFSPGQKYIVYASNAGNNVDIHLLFLESGQSFRLISGDLVDNWPSFSPDGSYLVYSSTTGDSKDIYAMAMDTREIIRLTDRLGSDTAPVWSP